LTSHYIRARQAIQIINCFSTMAANAGGGGDGTF